VGGAASSGTRSWSPFSHGQDRAEMHYVHFQRLDPPPRPQTMDGELGRWNQTKTMQHSVNMTEN
jgi:hypothetical protein